MAAILLLLTLGPAQTISGKYVPRPAVEMPAELPDDVDSLCVLIESGHEAPALFAALGEALLRRGDDALAYRAFDRAQRGGHADARWIQRRKDESRRVPDDVIRREEQEAKIWRDALASYRAARTARGLDPDDLTDFYERYGRPEESLEARVRSRRAAWIGGVAGVLLGAGFAIVGRRLRRRAAAIPLGAAALCLAGALLAPAGLLLAGAGASLVGGALVLLLGRRA